MKTSQFKQIIKEAVKEAIHEELKEILLEAIKTPRTTVIGTPNNGVMLKENIITQPPPVPVKSPVDVRKSYLEVLDEMKSGPKSPLEGELNITSLDTMSEGSSLPTGQVDLSQIMDLINK